MKTRDSSVPLSPHEDSESVKSRRKVQPEPAANTDRILLNALARLKSGDFSVRLPLDWTGIAGKVADTFNDVVVLNQRMSRELARLRKSVGSEGRINQRASLGEVEGTWAESVELINDLVSDLVRPTSETMNQQKTEQAIRTTFDLRQTHAIPESLAAPPNSFEIPFRTRLLGACIL